MHDITTCIEEKKKNSFLLILFNFQLNLNNKKAININFLYVSITNVHIKKIKAKDYI